jgi:glycosyltransferase involved in cell wall biosynthesis
MKVAFLTTDNREHYGDYACPEPYFGTAPEALLQGFAQLPELEVHVVCCVQQPVRSPEKIAPNIFYHSLVVPKLGWMRTLYQGCIRATRKKLREIQPDIIHGQGTERNCAISAVFGGFPNVLTLHGNMRIMAQLGRARPLSFYWLAARLEAFALPRSEGIICITNYTQTLVKSLACKTWIVPNATDTRFFELQPEVKLEPPILLCVGAVCPRKNQNAFISALDPVATWHKFRLVFLGDAPSSDPYGREFLELIRERSWCEHAGFVDRETLKRWLREASLLVLPSIEDNCPMVVLEAAAAGVPVVAANVGGIPDLIEDGKNGLLCDPFNATSMGGTVEKLLAQPELARTLAREANRRAQERFHPMVIARRHLEIYREVLGTSDRAGNE